MNLIKTAITATALLFSALAAAAPVNVNSASAEMLAAGIDGVGPVIASRIVEYREMHGGFEAPRDLMQVKGIAERIVEKNAEVLRID